MKVPEISANPRKDQITDRLVRSILKTLKGEKEFIPLAEKGQDPVLPVWTPDFDDIIPDLSKQPEVIAPAHELGKSLSKRFNSREIRKKRDKRTWYYLFYRIKTTNLAGE